MAMETTKPPEILKLHSEMVRKVGELISLKDKEWRTILIEVETRGLLSAADVGDIKTMGDLFSRLMKRESAGIKYGEYTNIKEILEFHNVEAGQMIDNCTERIHEFYKDVPEFELTEKCYTTKVGHPVILKCRITKSKTAITNVQWKRKAKGSDTFKDIGIDNDIYTGGSLESPSLGITKTREEDNGAIYVCHATNAAGREKSDEIQLIIQPEQEKTLKMWENMRSRIETEAKPFVEEFGQITGLSLTLELDLRVSSLEFAANNNPGDVETLHEILRRQIRRQIDLDLRAFNLKIVKGCIIVSFDIIGATHPLHASALALAERFSTGLKHGSIVLHDEYGNPLEIQHDSIKITMTRALEAATDMNKPLVSIDQAAYCIETGGIAILTCRLLTSTPISSVLWYRINEDGTEKPILIDNDKYFGSSVESLSLAIDEITTEDEGRYVCYAKNNIGVGKSFSTAVCIFGGGQHYNMAMDPIRPPEILKVHSKMVQKLGELFPLKGKEWRAILEEIEMIGLLSVADVGDIKTMEELFSCLMKIRGTSITYGEYTDIKEILGSHNVFAEEIIDNSTRHIHEIYQDVPEFELTKKCYTTKVGHPVILKCRITKSKTAITNVQWKRKAKGSDTFKDIGIDNDIYTGGSLESPSLGITKTREEDNGAIYVCHATNAAGREMSDEIQLVIQPEQETRQHYDMGLDTIGTPEIFIHSEMVQKLDVPLFKPTETCYTTKVGHPVILKCRISKSKTATTNVQWKRKAKDSDTFTDISIDNDIYTGGSPESPSLGITKTREEDNGAVYVCHATNAAGRDMSDEIQLIIQPEQETIQHYGMSMDPTGPPEILKLHNEMVRKLGKLFQHKDREWQAILKEVEISDLLSAADVRDIETIGDLFSRCMSKEGTGIKYGEYTNIRTILASHNVFAEEIIDHCTGRIHEIYIDVPKFEPTEKWYTTKVGHPVILKCRISKGKTAITNVQWKRKAKDSDTFTDISIDNDLYTGGCLESPSLSITKTREEDNGAIYVCHATNAAGKEMSDEIQLIIQPEQETISKMLDNIRRQMEADAEPFVQEFGRITGFGLTMELDILESNEEFASNDEDVRLLPVLRRQIAGKCDLDKRVLDLRTTKGKQQRKKTNAGKPGGGSSGSFPTIYH